MAVAAVAAAAAQRPAAPPELVIQAGHSGTVNALAFSPDGRWLASGSSDHTIRLWEVSSARLARVFTGDLGKIIAVAFSPDGKLLASGSDDDTLILWDIAGGNELREIDSPAKLECVAFSHDGSRVGTCDTANPRAWLVASGRPAAGSAGGGKVASANRVTWMPTTDGGARVTPAGGGRSFAIPPPPKVTVGHTVLRSSVDDLHFSPGGRWLVAQDRNSLRLFDARTGRLLRPLIADMIPFGSVNCWAFSPDGRYFAEASGDDPGERDFRLWDLATGAEHRLNGYAAPVVSTSISADGRFFATAGQDGRAAIWDLRTGQLIRTVVYRDADGGMQSIVAVALNADGSRMAMLTGDEDAPIAIYDVRAAQVAQRVDDEDTDFDPSQPNADAWPQVRYLGDARHLLTCTHDEGAILWSLASGKAVKSFDGAYPCAFGGSDVAVLSAHGPVLLHPLAAASGVAPPPVPGAKSRAEAQAAEFSAGIDPTALSEDRRWFAIGTSDGVIHLADLLHPGRARKLEGHTDAITALAFSPGGELISGSADNTIRVWDPESGALRHTLRGSAGPIHALHVTPDGRWLFSTGLVTVRLWDLRAARLAASLEWLRGGDGWAVVAPSGLFDGSDAGARCLVAWRLGDQLFAPDRFYADFFTPELLARILGGGALPAVNIAALKLPPSVRIVSPRGGTAAATEISVQVAAQDRGGGVSQVLLYQNGKLVGRSAPARSFGAGAGGGVPGGFRVDLVPGENTLRAVALAADGVEGNDDVVRVTAPAGIAAAAPTLHVLAIGLNRYRDAELDLGYAQPDASSVADFFRRRAGTLFGKVDVHLLTNARATRAGILAGLAGLADVRRQDVVVVYLAGHGIALGEQFYFLPFDTQMGGDPEAAIRGAGISATALAAALYRIPALKQLLVLDACESGAALPLLSKVIFRAPFARQRAERLLAGSTGIYLISAALKQQYAIEVPALHHGVLTYALLRGLGESGAPRAATTRDGLVTVEALMQYVKQQVPILTREYSGGEQDPIGLAYGTDFPLVLH
jgi:WD40 repeat protein